MKNVFFGLAFMLVGTLTFANNGKAIFEVNSYLEMENINGLRSNDFYSATEVEASSGICTVTITETDSKGNTHTTTYSWESSSAGDCLNSAQVVIVAHFA